MRAGCFIWRVDGSLLLVLELLEQGVEPFVIPFPDPTVALDPIGRLGQRPRLQAPRPALRLAAAGNQPGALQDLEVLRDGGLAHVERLRQLGDGRLAAREARQDTPARRVGECRERGVQIITSWFHN